jgi:acetyltransferase-like isoleucine patch superfamily enzyme
MNDLSGLLGFVRRRAGRAVTSAIQAPRRLALKVASTAKQHGEPLLVQPSLMIGSGGIRFGSGVELGCDPSPYLLSTYAHLEARHSSAMISIGDDTKINNGFVAISNHHSITIGRRVLIGYLVEVVDSDFHGLAVADRHRNSASEGAPVEIGDDVFIGSGTRILKGVTIGRGSVIGAGSLVVNSVPEGSVAVGVPARVIKKVPA